MTLDESLIKFHGRVIFKQYNKAKPAKFGLLTRVLAHSKTNFIINIELYVGGQVNENATKPLVLRILKPFINDMKGVYR